LKDKEKRNYKMDFYDVIEKRRSIRGFNSTPVSKDVLERIGRAVYLAPSACNLQPWKLQIITNQEIRNKICNVYTRDWLASAPAIAVILGNKDAAWKRQEGTSIIDVDIAIAMEHLVLAATAEGLGSCWICAYSQAEMNKALEITAPWNALAISPIGYTEKEAADISKKSINEIIEIVE
jgi:nitroreductase